MKKPNNVDEYISGYPKQVQKILEELRMAIKQAAPQATEIISYGMPAFKLNGMFVWFGAHTNHTGFYPKGSGIEAFKNELSVYKTSKGAVQFPFDKPLPLKLITKIVKFRMAENNEKIKMKKK